MSIKNEFRKKYKQARKNISEKRSKDKLINEFLCNMECYKSCDMVLFYAALDDEVNLDLSIKASLDYGKKVALPVCIDNNGKMQYYYIRSLDDVKIGAFGVREPDVNFCSLVDDYTDAICIVPAIAFDKSGYRLGYGKGYYDRFLSRFKGDTAGICYECCISNRLPRGRFDRYADVVVTEKRVISNG